MSQQDININLPVLDFSEALGTVPVVGEWFESATDNATVYVLRTSKYFRYSAHIVPKADFTTDNVTITLCESNFDIDEYEVDGVTTPVIIQEYDPVADAFVDASRTVEGSEPRFMSDLSGFNAKYLVVKATTTATAGEVDIRLCLKPLN